jgi:hypothetical protein
VLIIACLHRGTTTTSESNFIFLFLQGLQRLQNEIASFEKQKSEELERLEKFRDEEMQKLR